MNIEELLNSACEVENRLQIRCEIPEQTAAFTVSGDCQEGKQIYDGDTVLVALDRMPRPGDPCLCIVRKVPMFKVFHATIGGSKYAVGTCYSSRMNRGFIASEIGGVIIGCFDEYGVPRWLNDYRSYPEKLMEAAKNTHSNVCFTV